MLQILPIEGSQRRQPGRVRSSAWESGHGPSGRASGASRSAARYDRATIDAILDEALVCHLGFVHDGHPYVIPTLFARIGDELFVHGSSASRMLRTLDGGVDACLTVTLVDGLVLARSIFNHSINYRSVVVLGRARAGATGREAPALEAFSERLLPGRWARRPAADREGAEGDLDPPPAARRGLGEAAQRAAEGRRGRLRLAGLGGRDPARARGRRAGSGPPARGRVRRAGLVAAVLP